MGKKIIFISGSSSGLGLAIIKRFSKEGHTVYAGTRDVENLRLVLDKNGIYSNVIIMPINITDDLSVKRSFSSILEQGIEIDILINNAAYGLVGSVEDVALASVEDIFNVNLFGALRCIKAILPSMRKRGVGTILNIVSDNNCKPFLSAYGASKNALDFFSKDLSQEVEDFGISVLSFNPGLMKTQFVAKSSIIKPKNSPYYKKISDYVSVVKDAIDKHGIDLEIVVDKIKKDLKL